MFRVVGDRSDIVVAHRKIDAGIAIRVSDRTVRSQSAPNSVRIIAPVWMVVIEVSRPIDDRRAFPHGCLLCGHAAAARPGVGHCPIWLEASIGTRARAIRLADVDNGLRKTCRNLCSTSFYLQTLPSSGLVFTSKELPE